METPNDEQQKATQFSEKLRTAAAEILEILKKHDIAGVAHLFEPGFNEYVMDIGPSWSCVATNEKGQLNITDPIVHPEFKDIHKKKIADSVNMLANLRLYSGKLSIVLTQAEMATRQHFNIKPPPKPNRPIINNPNFINGKKRN